MIKIVGSLLSELFRKNEVEYSEKQTVAINFGITIFPYFKPKGEKYLALEFFARTYLTPKPKNISIKGKCYCIMHILSKNIAKSFSGMVT